MVRFMVWHTLDGRVQVFGMGRLPLDNWGVYQINEVLGQLMITKVGESSSRERQPGGSREQLMSDGRFLFTSPELAVRDGTVRHAASIDTPTAPTEPEAGGGDP
jgi:hypothetical protein